jgi:hypothetical protein
MNHPDRSATLEYPKCSGATEAVNCPDQERAFASWATVVRTRKVLGRGFGNCNDRRWCETSINGYVYFGCYHLKHIRGRDGIGFVGCKLRRRRSNPRCPIPAQSRPTREATNANIKNNLHVGCLQTIRKDLREIHAQASYDAGPRTSSTISHVPNAIFSLYICVSIASCELRRTRTPSAS